MANSGKREVTSPNPALVLCGQSLKKTCPGCEREFLIVLEPDYYGSIGSHPGPIVACPFCKAPLSYSSYELAPAVDVH